MPSQVVIRKKAEKDLQKVPTYIVDKLDEWIEAVETDRIHEVRKVPGYHDEALKGKRLGQRSIRLSKAYRAIYEINRQGNIELVSIKEVNKHDY